MSQTEKKIKEHVDNIILNQTLFFIGSILEFISRKAVLKTNGVVTLQITRVLRLSSFSKPCHV